MTEEIEGCSGCKSLVKQWARECDDTDELLAMLGISATVARTECGSLHIGKLRELICTFQAAGQMYEAAIEEMVETLRIARECLDNNELAMCAGAIDAAIKVGADKTANDLGNRRAAFGASALTDGLAGKRTE